MFGKDFRFPMYRHLLRHTATVPKGFLRYQVLELLNEKPMSGSEIMNEIERRTNGCWRPSPGSVYPLLSWLQDNGYIREVPAEEVGVKRYTLTDKGKLFLEEQRRIFAQSHMDRKFLVLPLISELWLRIPPEKTEEVRSTLKRLFRALINLGITLGERFSDQTLMCALDVLNEAARRLEELEKQVRGETP